MYSAAQKSRIFSMSFTPQDCANFGEFELLPSSWCDALLFCHLYPVTNSYSVTMTINFLYAWFNLSRHTLPLDFTILYSAKLPIYLFEMKKNKAGYPTTPVACGWAGAVLEKVTRAFGEEQKAQKAQKWQKSKKGTNQPTDRRTDIAGCRVA